MIYNQDCVTGMQQHVDDNSIDLIFTDPPYGISGDKLDAHYNRKTTGIIPGYVEVAKETYGEFSLNWITECARVLRPGGSIYIVSGYTNLHHILNALHSTDLIEVNHLIAQYSFGVYTKHKFVSSHYHLLFWQKPGRRTFNQRFTDTKQSYADRQSVQTLLREYSPGKLRNQNQLSQGFIDKFIEISSNPGDTVLDPFSGSFSTQRSAQTLGRQFVGFEINKNAYQAFGT
jgi:site-specific DNA-methyltransferase (adenine-specific)